MSKDEVKFQEDYKYGFKDEDTSIVNTGIGLTEDVVRQISKLKGEPEWMLEFRLYPCLILIPIHTLLVWQMVKQNHGKMFLKP